MLTHDGDLPIARVRALDRLSQLDSDHDRLPEAHPFQLPSLQRHEPDRQVLERRLARILLAPAIGARHEVALIGVGKRLFVKAVR
jgi:hypothetical protein